MLCHLAGTLPFQKGVEEVIIDAVPNVSATTFASSFEKHGKYPVKTGNNYFNFATFAENIQIYSLRRAIIIRHQENIRQIRL